MGEGSSRFADGIRTLVDYRSRDYRGDLMRPDDIMDLVEHVDKEECGSFITFVDSLPHRGIIKASDSGLICRDCAGNCNNNPKPATCETDGKCFIRRDVNDMVYRGCADSQRWSGLDLTYNGCSFQTYLGWNQRQAYWCLCDTDHCNELPLKVLEKLNETEPKHRKENVNGREADFSNNGAIGFYQDQSNDNSYDKDDEDLYSFSEIDSLHERGDIGRHRVVNGRIPRGEERGLRPLLRTIAVILQTTTLPSISQGETSNFGNNYVSEVKGQIERNPNNGANRNGHLTFQPNPVGLIGGPALPIHGGRNMNTNIEPKQGSFTVKAGERMDGGATHVPTYRLVIDAGVNPSGSAELAAILSDQDNNQGALGQMRNEDRAREQVAKSSPPQLKYEIMEPTSTPDIPENAFKIKAGKQQGENQQNNKKTATPFMGNIDESMYAFLNPDMLPLLKKLIDNGGSKDTHDNPNLQDARNIDRNWNRLKKVSETGPPPSMMFPATGQNVANVDNNFQSTLSVSDDPILQILFGTNKTKTNPTVESLDRRFYEPVTDPVPTPTVGSITGKRAQTGSGQSVTARGRVNGKHTAPGTDEPEPVTRVPGRITNVDLAGILTGGAIGTVERQSTLPLIDSTTPPFRYFTCPDGFDKVDRLQSCYKIVRSRMSHQRATQHCSRHGRHAHLLSIESVDEYQYIFTKLWNQGSLLNGWQGWWTSGIFDNNIREFVWGNSGYAISRLDTRWHLSLLIAPFQQTCVWLVPLVGLQFGNYGCAQSSGFICEIDFN